MAEERRDLPDNDPARRVIEEAQRKADENQALLDSPQGIDPIGQLGGVQFGQADPRTDFMRMLEMASAPMLFNALLNPGGIPGMLGASPLGQGGSGPGTDLLGALLGGGAMQRAGAQAGGLLPGAGAIGGENPLMALLQGAFGGQLPAGSGGGNGGGAQANGGSSGPGSTGIQRLAGGGELQDSDINIVGEAGPEAVIDDQVIPLDGQQDPQVLSAILQAVLSGSADFLQQGGPLDEGQGRQQQFIGAFGGTEEDPLQITSPEQGQQVLQQGLGNARQQAGQRLQDFIGRVQQIGDPASQQRALTEQLGAQFGETNLNMDAINAITGAAPSTEPQQTSAATGVQTAQGGGSASASAAQSDAPDLSGGNQTDQPAVGGQQTQFSTMNQQNSPGIIGQLLNQNPEQQAFGVAQEFLTGEEGLLGQAPGQRVIDAAQAPFERNLQRGLQELSNRAPSVFGSGMAIQGTDLTSQALEDFNMMSAQAAQQGISQQLQGLGTLGQMAVPAGQNPFQRALGAGQFGLAAQNQAFNQQMQPTMQLLSLALQQASPTGMQTIGGPQTEGK